MPAAAVAGAAASAALSIPLDGLVALFDAGSKASYPGTGTTWYNIAKGNVSNATCSNITFSNGSATFNGSTSYASFTNNEYFAAEQTLILIVKPADTLVRRNPYSQAYGGFGTITHEIGGQISYYHGNRGSDGDPYQGTRSTGTGIANGQVAMITVVRSATDVRWYINNTLNATQGNGITSAISTTTAASIGRGYAGPNYYGDINFVAIYKRAITASEVSRVYNEIRWRYGI